MYRNVLSCTL